MTNLLHRLYRLTETLLSAHRMHWYLGFKYHDNTSVPYSTFWYQRKSLMITCSQEQELGLPLLLSTLLAITDTAEVVSVHP